MGFFLETIPVFVISIGTIYPLLTGLGYDGVWFGVLSTIVLTAGMITPPVGLCLYVVQAIPPGYRLSEVMRGTIPFLVILYLAVALLSVLGKIGSAGLTSEIERFVKHRRRGLKSLLVRDKVTEAANRVLKSLQAEGRHSGHVIRGHHHPML